MSTDDPTGEIRAAWACKELLRQLLAGHGPTRYSRHEAAPPHPLPDGRAAAGMPETTRLATTIETWWPEIEVFLKLRVDAQPAARRTSGPVAQRTGRERPERTFRAAVEQSRSLGRPRRAAAVRRGSSPPARTGAGVRTRSGSLSGRDGLLRGARQST